MTARTQKTTSKSQVKTTESKTSKSKTIKTTQNKQPILPTQSSWDLRVLFPNNNAAKSACSKAFTACKDFNARYENKLSKISASEFEKVIGEYENLCENLGRIATYAFLQFAKNTANGALYADFELKIQKAQNFLIFFELEIPKIDAQKLDQILKNCTHYRFYLQKILSKSKYDLSIKEEQVLLKVAPVGSDAFSRLFDEHLSQLKFNLNGKSLSEEEILTLLHNKSRKTRKNAQKTFTKKLKKSAHLLTYILNIIRKDVAITKDLRKYAKPETFRHISNHISQKSVDSLIDCVNANFGVVQEFYFLKSKLLGVKKLKDFDRYAPLDFTLDSEKQKENSTNSEIQNLDSQNPNFQNLNKSASDKVPYDQALQKVLDCFENFSPIFAQIAQDALKNGWVDSHPTQNKRGGAFSHSATPSTHPYVMLNYTNSRRDIFTIAHEFGHMIHQNLSNKVGYLNADTPLTTAETASVFAEMLLFENLKKTLPKNELISLYAGKLEDIFSTLFRQVVMTNFEREIHARRGELSTEQFNEIWASENAKMFGKSVHLTKNYSLWWCYIPHFIHSPFYCYAYSYGQLLVLALFGLYRAADSEKARKKFIKTYIDFLSAGGSKSPRTLIKKFGFDIEDSKFWEIGMSEVKRMMGEFKELL